MADEYNCQNALANHGYLPRDGRNIRCPETYDALNQFGLSALFRWVLAWPTFLERQKGERKKGFWNFLTDPGVFLLRRFGGALAKFGCRFPGQLDDKGRKWINLDQTQLHGAIECDVSLTRLDLAQGDNSAPQQHLVDELLKCSSNGKTITFDDFVQFRHKRFAQQKKDNPDLYFHNDQLSIGCGNIAMLLKVFGDGKEVPVKYIEAIFRDERLPIAEGWSRKRWWTVGLIELATLNKKLQNIIGLPDKKVA